MKLYYIKRKYDLWNDKYLSDKILDVVTGAICAMMFMMAGAALVVLLFKKYGGL